MATSHLVREPIAPMEYEAEWTPEPVWVLWRREKYLAFSWESNYDYWRCSLQK
jgi:hypothetical protein